MCINLYNSNLLQSDYQNQQIFCREIFENQLLIYIKQIISSHYESATQLLFYRKNKSRYSTIKSKEKGTGQCRYRTSFQSQARTILFLEAFHAQKAPLYSLQLNYNLSQEQSKTSTNQQVNQLKARSLIANSG